MIQLGEVLKAVGPNAAIVFAAWIFMGFLQQRYDSAIDRYREAVGDYRSNDHERERAANLKDQVLGYHARCKLMGRATFAGLAAATLLIGALIFGGLDVLIPGSAPIALLGTFCTLVGFGLVIAAALIVMLEARIVRRQLDAELEDLSDLAQAAGRVGGRKSRAEG